MLSKQNLPSGVLKKILGEYDLGKIGSASSLQTSGNIAFKIKTASAGYVLRLCPKGSRWRGRKEVAAEIELLFYLRRHNFPVAVPIKQKSSGYIASWRKHNGYLRKFIEGKEKANPNIEEIARFGKLLGRFHKCVFGYKTRERRKHLFNLGSTKKYFLKSEKKIKQSPEGKKFAEIFKQEINQLKFPAALPSGMIHEDLGKRHVLWKNGKITGIIDFDRSYHGKLIFDLGQACRGWCFVKNWSRWSNKNFRALMKDYGKERKLKKIEADYLADAIKFGILERALSFYMRFIEITKDEEDKKYALLSVMKLIGEVERNRREINKIAASGI
jgi:homoserine kinase type II